MNLGAPELLILLFVLLLLFGASRLPNLARSMGKSASEFKKGVGEAVPDLPVESPGRRREMTVTGTRSRPAGGPRGSKGGGNAPSSLPGPHRVPVRGPRPERGTPIDRLPARTCGR